MALNQRKLAVGAAIAVAAIALVLGLTHREGLTGEDESEAEAALHRLDPHTARESLTDRCKTPPKPDDLIATRACAALRDTSALDDKPLVAAARLNELSHASPPASSRPMLDEIQVMRVELLITAGHSREAAHEAQAWADARKDDETVGAVRLWVAAMRAQRAVGYDDQAGDDARHAIHLAARVKH